MPVVQDQIKSLSVLSNTIRTKVPHIGYQIHDFTGTGLVNAIVPTHGTLVSSIPWCKGEEKE